MVKFFYGYAENKGEYIMAWTPQDTYNDTLREGTGGGVGYLKHVFQTQVLSVMLTDMNRELMP